MDDCKHTFELFAWKQIKRQLTKDGMKSWKIMHRFQRCKKCKKSAAELGLKDGDQ